MLYIPESVGVDVVGRIIVCDSDTNEEVINCAISDFWDELVQHGIVPQTVVGLFKKDSTLLITPVTKIEMQVMKLLKVPYFFVRDTLGDGGAKAYGSYGLYNFTTHEVRWSAPDTACSIAKLLLETCGEVQDLDTTNQRIETTTDYVAVCVDNTKYQSTYLRFDIEDYTKVQRAYLKYKMLKHTAGAGSFQITVD